MTLQTTTPTDVIAWLNPATGNTCSASEKFSMEKHQGLPGVRIAKRYSVPLVRAAADGEQLVQWNDAEQPFHINSDRTVAVGEHYWHPMSTCPRGVKVQLLGPHNVAVYSTYDGKDPQWRGWYPVPKIRKENA